MLINVTVVNANLRSLLR